MSERSARLRIVIDTNIFVSGPLSHLGNPFALLEAWRNHRFALLLSERQQRELTDVLSRPKFTVRYRVPPDEFARFSAGLSAATRVPLNSTIPLPVRDVQGEHILAAAIGGNADYLVSGDKDLLELAGDPRLGKLKIVTVAEFLAILDRVSPIDASD